MKSKHDKGFTLVEVMVALAVVAIVLTPLLQMFVTTSYVNKDAQVIDLANIIAVQQAETFKANPVSYRIDNGDHSYYFYKGDGALIAVYPDLTVIPYESAIMVESELPDSTDIDSNIAEIGYYPDFVGNIDLSQYTSDISEINVNITDIYEIEVEPAVIPPFIFDYTKINNNIPIRIDFGGNTITVNVINDSDLEAEFFIFNTTVDSDVILDTHQGYSSIAYVPTTSSSSYKVYNLTLTVNRLVNGAWVRMFTNSVVDYRYNN